MHPEACRTACRRDRVLHGRRHPLLTSFGEQKIAVIKIVKEVLALGLAEAKTMVESAPVMLKADVKKEDAEAWKKKIEEAGGKVTLK